MQWATSTQKFVLSLVLDHNLVFLMNVWSQGGGGTGGRAGCLITGGFAVQIPALTVAHCYCVFEQGTSPSLPPVSAYTGVGMSVNG